MPQSHAAWARVLRWLAKRRRCDRPVTSTAQPNSNSKLCVMYPYTSMGKEDDPCVPRVRKIYPSAEAEAEAEDQAAVVEPLPRSLLDPHKPKHLPCAFHITNAFSPHALEKLDALRLRIPLDVSRPTCPRRFLTEKRQEDCCIDDTENNNRQHQEDGWVGALIDSTLLTWNLTHTHSNHSLRSLPWFRFLEYSQGGYMDKHTDGSNLHPDTGERSVATMMLYLSTCTVGGETTLYHKKKSRPSCSKKMRKQQKEETKESIVMERIQPIRNTVLIFPHSWQHSGGSVFEDPKIALRVDLAWAETQTETLSSLASSLSLPPDDK
jgi:hypothetical protein